MEKLKIIAVIRKVVKLINSEEFKERHKSKSTDFTRECIWVFDSLIFFILKKIDKSIYRDIQSYWNLIYLHKCYKKKKKKGKKRSNIAKTPSKASFCIARKKINEEAFYEIFKVAIDYAYSIMPKNMKAKINYKNLFVFAIDSTTLRIEDTITLREIYGGQKNQSLKNGAAMARASMCVNVNNKTIVDAQIDRYDRGERSFVEGHIDAVLEMGIKNSELLFIFDRGYPSTDIIKLLEKKGVKYLIRMPLKGSFKAVTDANDLDQQISFKSKCYTISTRVINIELTNRDGGVFIEKLITNLTEQEMDYDDFDRLYFLRWNIEKIFKTLKTTLKIENFSGISKRAIKQDFYATIFRYNLYALINLVANNKVEEIMKKRQSSKYKKWVCKLSAIISHFIDYIPVIFLKASAYKISYLIDAILDSCVNKSDSREAKDRHRRDNPKCGVKQCNTVRYHNNNRPIV